MRIESFVRTLVALTLSLLLPAAAVSERGADLGDARAGIAASNRELAEAFHARDVERMVALFTPDARIMAPLWPTVEGRDEIREYLKHFLDTGVRELEIETEEVYGDGDTALEIGRTTSYLVGGQRLGRTRDMVLWKLEDGRWRVHRLLSN